VLSFLDNRIWKKESKMNRRLPFSAMTIALVRIGSILMGMAGIFMVLVGGFEAYEAYSSQFWPTTSGEIVQSYVSTYKDIYGNRTYLGKIKYLYSIKHHISAGESFTGERVGIDPYPPFDDRHRAKASLDQYPKGKNVDVYYNPNHPQRSILEPSFPRSKLIHPIAGGLFLALAIILRSVGKQKLSGLS
jgi:hypothetical protein